MFACFMSTFKCEQDDPPNKKWLSEGLFLIEMCELANLGQILPDFIVANSGIQKS